MELLAPPSDKDLNLSLLIYLKETVSVISSEPPGKNVRNFKVQVTGTL